MLESLSIPRKANRQHPSFLILFQMQPSAAFLGIETEPQSPPQQQKLTFDEAIEQIETSKLPIALESHDGLELYALRQQVLLGDNHNDEEELKYASLLEREQYKRWKQKRGSIKVDCDFYLLLGMSAELAGRKYAKLVQELLVGCLLYIVF
jgi:acyl-CoA-binding protein